jgi:hypothetical protein
MGAGAEGGEMPDGKLSERGGFWEGGDWRPTQCGTCRQRFYQEPRCNAYPEGIPLPIMLDRVSHREPQPGDGGIRWTPMPLGEPEGPVAFVFIHVVPAEGTPATCGALWYCPANDALGYEPVPGWEGEPETVRWLERVYRGGVSIAQVTRTGRELFEGWQERANGYPFLASEPETAASLSVVREALVSFARAKGRAEAHPLRP